MKKVESFKMKSEADASPGNVVIEYFKSFTGTLIVVLFGMTFVIQAVTVPTGSMQNTILIGDYLFVNKFIFNPGGDPLPFLPQREIQRGDIIVFKYPGNKVKPENDLARRPPLEAYKLTYVKRVIALPGETVEFRDNQVFINGDLLPERRIIGNAPNDRSALIEREFEPAEGWEKYKVYYKEYTMLPVLEGKKLSELYKLNYEFGFEGKPMRVPEDSFFVMGDNRDDSEDSRYWGFVPRNLVIGRAMFVYWSCDRGASGGGFFGCLTNPRLDRIGKLIK